MNSIDFLSNLLIFYENQLPIIQFIKPCGHLWARVGAEGHLGGASVCVCDKLYRGHANTGPSVYSMGVCRGARGPLTPRIGKGASAPLRGRRCRATAVRR